ncbi:STAS domain-containing protein [Streptomyces sp. NPDC051561]|uniref:STAS domain-containing protein n=1 Tax=Streptomyces sp. NPDC051561 TaxID=3365658 RepID=UPI0037969055
MQLSGELDIAHLNELTVLLRGTTEQTRDTWLIVDLRPVTFMDSAVLHELSTAQEHCEQAGHGLRLVYDQPFIGRLLALLGAAKDFPRYASADDAWAGREAPPQL